MSKRVENSPPTSAELAFLIDREEAERDEIGRQIAQAEADAKKHVVSDQEKYADAVGSLNSRNPLFAQKQQRISYLKANHAEALSRERDQELIQLRFDTWKAHKDMNQRYNEMAIEKEAAKKLYEDTLRRLNQEDSDLHNRVSGMRKSLHVLLEQRGLSPVSHEGIGRDAPPPMDRVAI